MPPIAIAAFLVFNGAYQAWVLATRRGFGDAVANPSGRRLGIALSLTAVTLSVGGMIWSWQNTSAVVVFGCAIPIWLVVLTFCLKAGQAAGKGMRTRGSAAGQ